MNHSPVVYIIDDDPSARKGLQRLTEAAGYQTESFVSAIDYLESVQNTDTGCIILDVQMPEMTGPELQEELLQRNIVLPIIFISAHGDVPTTAKAMKKGAVDFLTKPVDKNELTDAIKLSLKIDEENKRTSKSKLDIQFKIEKVTTREYEVLTYVIGGMLNKQIASAMNISEETVKIHRGRLMKKMEVVSVAELVRICERYGINPAPVESM